MEHVYENVAGTLFRALREELIKRFQRELSTFADDLNDWLYHLLENPTPDWRRDLEVFLVEQAAQGRVVTEEHREELLAFLEAWWLRFMEGTPVVRRYSKKREEPDSDAFSIFAEVGATVIGIFVEPIDWVMTGLEIYNDYKSPYSYAGLIPGVPSSAGKAAKALLKLGDEGSGVAKVVAEVGEEVAEAASTAKKIPNPHGRLGWSGAQGQSGGASPRA